MRCAATCRNTRSLSYSRGYEYSVAIWISDCSLGTSNTLSYVLIFHKYNYGYLNKTGKKSET